MKKFSGGDPIEVRKLYGDTFEFIPQFTITILCNDMPKVPPHDEGTWRRFTVSEHEARFVDNPTHKNEFKKDRKLSAKIKLWKHVFGSLLVDYFYIYQKEGLKPPTAVTRFTQQFKQECDSYDEFVTDILVEVPAEEDPEQDRTFISLQALYTSFKGWVDENGVYSRKPMSYRDFKKYISKKVSNPRLVKGNKLYAYRERSDGDLAGIMQDIPVM